MKVNPAYENIPFIQEKIKRLENLIEIDRDTIPDLEASDRNCLILRQVKEQLSRNEKLLQEITGGQLCP